MTPETHSSPARRLRPTTERTGDGPFSVARTTLSRCDAPEFRRDWQALVATSRNLYSQYQSPQWFDHLRAIGDPGLLPPLAVTDRDGRLAGIVPLSFGERDLIFTTKERILWRSVLQVVSILGSDPLMPDDPELVGRVFAEALDSAPGADGVYLHSVAADGILWRHLKVESRRRDRLVYLASGRRPFHFLELPETFQAYLAKFGAKKRYNLARQVRLLREQAAGRLELHRIERPQDVVGFAGDTATVVERSWQGELTTSGVTRAARDPRALEDLARRGLLRSYLLVCAGRPCAFVVGYQDRDVFHYAEIGYDREFGRFSPGAVLLYLLLEDLYAHRRPRWVNFGIGEAAYKREFGNRETTDASVFVLRRTAANLGRVRAHQAFRGIVELAKRLRSSRSPVATQSRMPRVGRDGDARD